MAVTATPVFTQAPFVATGQVSAANTNRDGTGTIVTIKAGTTNGTRIERVTVKATVTTTAGMVRLYLDDGTNVRLVKELVVSAITVAAGVAGFEAEWSRGDGLPVVELPASTYILKASTHNAEAMNVTAWGGEF